MLFDINLMKPCFMFLIVYFITEFLFLIRGVSGLGGGLAYSFVNRGLKLKPSHALFCAAGCAVLSGTEYKVID